MKRLLIFLLVLWVLPAAAQEFPTAAPESVGMSSDRLSRLSDMIQDYVDDGRLPGAVILVAKDGRAVMHESFGDLDREEGTPMATDAIFRIASQTKAVISVGVMILQEQGKLVIKDPVGKYMPEWMETTVAMESEDEEGGYDVVPAERRITIRDLLTHTAGIGYGWGPAQEAWEEAGILGWYFGHLDEPIRETVRRMAALPMNAQPGAEFVYGYNTDILGALIEVVSGQPLDEFVSEHITGPLQMNDTHFYLPRQKADRLAVVYSVGEEGLERTPDVSEMVGQGAYLNGPRRSFSGGAGLLSTAQDYARFLQMTLNGGELDGARILSPKTIELMTSHHTGDITLGPGVGFGLGFSVVTDVGAYGEPSSTGTYAWGGAYHSTYWVDPVENLVVSYFTQVLPATRLDDHAKLKTLIYQAILE